MLQFSTIVISFFNFFWKEEIWRDWISQGQQPNCPYSAELYIHAKFPAKISSPWARERTLTETFNPEWNSPEVIRAMLATLKWGLENPNNNRFVFATGFFCLFFV